MAPSVAVNDKSNGNTGHQKRIATRLFSQDHRPDLNAFIKMTSARTDPQDYPLASSVDSNIPIYDLSDHDVEDTPATNSLQDEWNQVLLSGPGVFVLKNFETDHDLLNAVNRVYDSIIKDEAATSKGDHFAAAGSNSRIWNSFQKHSERDPKTFVQYYANPWLSLVSEAWLGPAYQITAQVNLVHPGGKPQMAHRDYHLGFQTSEQAAQYPKAMHQASSLLTLQGAVVHTRMPLISGPTRFLPFSQTFEGGFMAYRLPQFSDYFEAHCVSLPLKKGDAVFFNPALFHAAGENKSTNIERSANLLQISSAFGRTMETIDTQAIIKSCWTEVVAMHGQEGMSLRVESAIKAVAEGYPFPTNLDRRPPAPGGMAPESEQDLLRRVLSEGWSVEETIEAVSKLQLDSRP